MESDSSIFHKLVLIYDMCMCVSVYMPQVYSLMNTCLYNNHLIKKYNLGSTTKSACVFPTVRGSHSLPPQRVTIILFSNSIS